LKQYHGGDVYWLARVAADSAIELQPDGQSFIIGGGDVCQALSPPAPRKVKVNWACRESATVRHNKCETDTTPPRAASICFPLRILMHKADHSAHCSSSLCFLCALVCIFPPSLPQTPQIITISEISTCVYVIQVASSLMCRDSSFPVIAANFVPSSTPVAMDTGSEDWFVELVELESSGEHADPILMCHAYSLEYRATSVKNLKFVSYELKITRLQGDTKSHRSQIAELPREYQTAVARRASRVPVDAAHLAMAYGQVALAPSTESEYDGALSFIKVYA
jgi:hypothetical protein